VGDPPPPPPPRGPADLHPSTEGFCSYCERSVGISPAGVMAAHPARRRRPQSGPTGSATGEPCPGSELTPRMARDLAVIDALRSSARDWPAGPEG
jgi:hypothetical protein